MYVEMTRGRSDIYDILTHLTFLNIEAEKIRRNSTDHKGRETPDWQMLREIVNKEIAGEEFDKEAACSYLSHITGRTFDETREAVSKFDKSYSNSLFAIIYYLGQLSIEENTLEKDREISFSATLRERVGHHVYGDLWATRVKEVLKAENLIQRPIHIISANLHSIVNVIYAHQALGKNTYEDIEKVAMDIVQNTKKNAQKDIFNYASRHGLIELPDLSGTNIGVQLIDTAKMDFSTVLPGVKLTKTDEKKMPVLLVMDYAFGEQAFECLDELFKPLDIPGKKSLPINVVSVSIMGKAGILQGGKGDIMIPTAHVFEGTADNYPIKNELRKSAFEGYGLKVFEGTMISVLGTSLQNKDVLRYFMESSWNAIGLEMEGAHYHKAIQSASKIRNNINRNVKVSYAYYASDNPLETGSTLASGALGLEGIRPTYLISYKILEKIFTNF